MQCTSHIMTISGSAAQDQHKSDFSFCVHIFDPKVYASGANCEADPEPCNPEAALVKWARCLSQRLPHRMSFWKLRIGESSMSDRSADRKLMARIARGDETALNSLITSHQRRIFSFVYRMLRNEGVADEVTNEVFLEAWRGARNFEGRSSLVTWLLAIAHHRSVNVLRKRHEENWNEDDALQLPDLTDNPEVTAQKSNKAALLRKCSGELSPSHREIIDLVYYHELCLSRKQVKCSMFQRVQSRPDYSRREKSWKNS